MPSEHGRSAIHGAGQLRLEPMDEIQPVGRLGEWFLVVQPIWVRLPSASFSRKTTRLEVITATPWRDMPDYHSTITDHVIELMPRLPEAAYIAGGALTRLFSEDETPADIDVWFADRATYMTTKLILQASPVKSWRTPKVSVSDESYRLNEGEITTFEASNKPSIQLIGSNFLLPIMQIARFDFLCCQMALVMRPNGLTFLASEGAIDDATAKIARIVNAESPARTGKRVEKYLAKGFTFVGHEKMAA